MDRASFKQRVKSGVSQLPHRDQVDFAAKCARLTLPLLQQWAHGDDPEEERSNVLVQVEYAIALATQFASGEDISGREAYRAYTNATTAAVEAAQKAAEEVEEGLDDGEEAASAVNVADCAAAAAYAVYAETEEYVTHAAVYCFEAMDGTTRYREVLTLLDELIAQAKD